MFDSNMFDKIIDETISLSLLQSHDAVFYVTPIQRQELEDTPGERAEKLLESFELLADEEVEPIATFNTRGVEFNNTSYISNKQSEIFNNILEAHAPGEVEDANMATVAVSHGITLITSDGRFQNALERTYPESYISREDFVAKLKDRGNSHDS